MREQTSNKETLAYVWTALVDATKPRDFETETTDDGHEVYLYCGHEVYNKFSHNANAMSIIADLLGWLSNGDKGDAGEVTVNGWYEAPRFCWSDPSCSDAGDGDVTSMMVSLADGLEDSFRDDIASYFKDMASVDTDMDIDAVIECCRAKRGMSTRWATAARRVVRMMPKVLANELYSKLNGTDIL